MPRFSGGRIGVHRFEVQSRRKDMDGHWNCNANHVSQKSRSPFSNELIKKDEDQAA